MCKVKFCGLTRPCDMAWANELRPDYVGLVFAGKKRRVDAPKAQRLRQALDPDIPAVGVFVNADIFYITSLVQHGIIQLVQLHGQEDETYLSQLRQYIKVPIIQAFTLKEKADLSQALKSSADYLLFDYGQGGTGKTFDWSLLAGVTRPYFLAGGLNVTNVAAALKYAPYALDVSSGIETDGVKDKEKMQAFMAQVRREEENNE